MAEIKIRRALISVWDKTGIVDFARALHDEFGVEILSTGGTAKTLKDAGVPVTLVEEATGFPEMMDGRVKTLHPRIHAAILADRDNPEHMRQLDEQGIEPIDMVIVNLYPFEQTIAKPGCTFEEAIEMIDIGGPCLLRAAAKNHRHVLVINQPHRYIEVLKFLRGTSDVAEGDLRRWQAFNTFREVCEYNAEIAGWLSKDESGDQPAFRIIQSFRTRVTRYGENSHQNGEAAFRYDAAREVNLPVIGANAQPEMSFNNYADASAALELCAELTRAGSAKFHFAHANESAKCNFAVPAAQEETRPAAAHRKTLNPVYDELTYRRKLPHWQIAGASYFVTFSSAAGQFDDAERDIVMDALKFWDGKRLDLHAAVVMREHVHLLLTPRRIKDECDERYNVSELMQSIKANSARAINKKRGGSGQIWVRESYDRWMRDEEEFMEKWEYIANNPIKEGLATTPDDYRWWFGRETLGAFEEEVAPGGKRGEAPQTLGTNEDSLRLKGEENVRPTQPGTNEDSLCSKGEENVRPTQPGTNEDSLRLKGEENLRPTVCFIKHTNACGSAVDADPIEAYRRAYLGDPNAAMGGILAVNFTVTAEFAAAVMETYQRWGKPLKEAGAAYAPGGFFVEVWIAPSFTEDAVAIIRGTYAAETAKPVPGEARIDTPPKKDWGQRVRLLDVGDMGVEPDADEMDFKRIAGGVLMQTRDLVGLNEEQWQVVTERQPTAQELNDLRLAWLVCKHTKSNAITICKDGTLIGNGAGQMSRVMSCRIATWAARENGHAEELQEAVAASDAFFPFRDGPDILADAGVTALIQPGGSKRDEDTIQACDERGIAMIFTGTRHFKH